MVSHAETLPVKQREFGGMRTRSNQLDSPVTASRYSTAYARYCTKVLESRQKKTTAGQSSLCVSLCRTYINTHTCRAHHERRVSSTTLEFSTMVHSTVSIP